MGVHRPRPRLTYGVCTAANPTTRAAGARGRRTISSRRASSARHQAGRASWLRDVEGVSRRGSTHAALAHEATEADRDTVVPDLLR